MSPLTKWQHKEFEESDKDKILELRKRVFQENDYDEARWNWQYLNNAQGRSFVDLAVDKENPKILAGHYAVISYRLRWNGIATSAAQSLDTFTSPDYQRQGIFVDLAETTFKNCLKHHVNIIFGFPNQSSYGGFVKKLSFEDPFGFKIYRKPLRLSYYLKRYIGKNPLNGIRISSNPKSSSYTYKEVDEFDKKLLPIFQKFHQLFPFMVDRNVEYWNWRYSDKSGRRYKKFLAYSNSDLIGSFIIGCDKSGDFAHLVDFCISTIQDFPIILDLAISYCMEETFSCLTFFTNENSRIEKNLQSKNFRTKDQSQQFRFILRNLASPTDIPAEAKISKNWLITAGDTDFY